MDDMAPPQSNTQCPQGKHDLKWIFFGLKNFFCWQCFRLKELVAVNFMKADGEDEHYQCPSCLKTLRNGCVSSEFFFWIFRNAASRMNVHVLSGCGHTCCEVCIATLTDKQCFTCQKKFKSKHIGIKKTCLKNFLSQPL